MITISIAFSYLCVEANGACEGFAIIGRYSDILTRFDFAGARREVNGEAFMAG